MAVKGKVYLEEGPHEVRGNIVVKPKWRKRWKKARWNLRQRWTKRQYG